MANRNFASGGKLYSMHVMPVIIDGSFTVDGSGNIASSKGPLIASITHAGPGLYQIKLQDNYNQFLNFSASADSPVTGAAVDPHTATVNTAVQITTVGNTDWASAGLPSGVTAAVGVTFVLTAQPLAGTGRVKAIGSSGVSSIEMAGDPNATIAPDPMTSMGSVLIMQTLQAQIGAATVQGTPLQYAPVDPASGSTINFSLLLSNSSVKTQGE